MTRRPLSASRWLPVLTLTAMAAAHHASADEPSPHGTADAASGKPNVIVIFTDDHGYTDLGCQGIRADIKTPHIDALAARGVRLTDGYVTAPQCVPSRAGLLTGRHQNRFGVESNGEPLDGFDRQLTIAERLREAGYATGMTGKWHLGPAAQITRHGFDDVYAKHSKRPGWANFDLKGRDREGGAEDSEGYHIDVNSEAACAFIRRRRDRPFFFYCAYRAPHVPLDAPPKYLRRFPGEMPERRRQALAMLSAVDDGVGRIMATLREWKLERRTLVFFIGDNGAPLKIHRHDAPGGGPGWDGSLNDPLNGEKGMLSEGGIRVPFIVSWPGALPEGRTYAHPVTSLDVAATALAAVEASNGPGQAAPLDGVDLVPPLNSNQPAHKQPLYWRWIAQAAARDGKWKYLRAGGREYLFDLEADREEQRNLLDAQPKMAASLRQKLTAWTAGLQPPGLQTRTMSATWETYYDVYLDGQPAPPMHASGRTVVKSLEGWVVRNGTGRLAKGMLHVEGERKSRGPFIARAGISITGPAKVSVSLAAAPDGPVAVGWREQGQRRFPPSQVSKAAQGATGTKQSADSGRQVLHFDLPGAKRVVHLRVLLPPGSTKVDAISIEGAGDSRQAWEFGP